VSLKKGAVNTPSACPLFQKGKRRFDILYQNRR
jgi:hypothetical protein